jgi:hypothetical protein
LTTPFGSESKLKAKRFPLCLFLSLLVYPLRRVCQDGGKVSKIC